MNRVQSALWIVIAMVLLLAVIVFDAGAQAYEYMTYLPMICGRAAPTIGEPWSWPIGGVR